ncbi:MULTISPECIES: hypothetical protein [unclassified Sphingomonas]|uniref:hypothetical protein n=1 Tax=unclassified Sphingomonas TaxID=196159 RepID=UPI000A53EF86|nr:MULTISPECIES: hypothetical protein [unclassified Sphingomonas]
MQPLLLLLSCLTLAPHGTQQQAPKAAPQPRRTPPPPAALTLRNGMIVYSSDGIAVAKTVHIRATEQYAPDASFFTDELKLFMERRIYAREAWVDGDVVRLRITAKQFFARSQNPPE